MWGRWVFAGAGFGSLRKRVSRIVNLSHDYVEKFHPFDPPLLGLSGFASVEYGERLRGISSLSVVFMNQMKKRGISSSTNSNNSSEDGNKVTEDSISFSEAKKLMRLVNVESLKMKLDMEGKEVISYSELLQACESMGVARNKDESAAFARILDDAGVILLFRDKVYLHPDKVVDLVRRAVPLALTSEDDPAREELKKLQEKKEEIDLLAHKQVRRILWSGLGFGVITVGLFFRLTFWEFSWDVMEPIAFFTTTTGLVIGYAYFLITSRDPTYQDFMKRLFLSRQKNICKRLNFDVERFKELQCKCKSPLDATTVLKKRVGVEVDLEDTLHRD
ncbi:hypothetical protein TanjilG_21256 [Lupinus angustifolius]|uniref:Calcium uniporter protein C-terminal domain-containing protein n=1 Tax=Lupinus angustifolius TaxID=3871 RepID=A0A4P1RMJ1_LUPAN|nr:PREDICTED: calcium uniporter protein 6, mitochondrial-like [Lupinus angustifolius]OIW14116.1 hypothetical protein TanjilG_21256 [Lupinus angustifolius]